MSTAMVGPRRERPDGRRVPINIDVDTREKLIYLLHRPYMRGVGYSEFIERAIACAYEEAERHEEDAFT